MNIKIDNLSVGIVDHKIKWRKSKKTGRRHKRKVPLKKPYISVDCTITVYKENFSVGSVYLCDKGNHWMCIQKMDLMQYESTFRICKTAPHKTFQLPTSLILYGTQIGES